MTQEQKDYLIKLIEKDVKIDSKILEEEAKELNKRILDINKSITELEARKEKVTNDLINIQTEISNKEDIVQALEDSIIIE